MEHANWMSPKVQTDRNEKQPKMDPRAWLVKVAILRIELQQKDPTLNARSSWSDQDRIELWHLFIMSEFTKSSKSDSDSDRLGPAYKIAVLDTFELYNVTWTVKKNVNLGEVLAQAARSIRKAYLHCGGSHGDISKWYLFRLLESNLHALAGSRPRSKQKDLDASEPNSKLAIACTFLAFLTSVLHLLTSVFQYLIGSVDRGGSKIYSSGAFDFRDIFIALVLFQGAYVWIKFRQAAQADCRKRKAPDVEYEVVDIEGCNLKSLRKRSIKNTSGDFVRFKYEPRFTPPRQEEDGGTNLCSKRLPLGEYYTQAEAQIVLQIARYYCKKDGGRVELKYGPCKLPIPPMSEQERGLTSEAKRTWVQCKAKQVGKQMYADFEREKGELLVVATEAGSQGAEFNDPSSTALPLPCSSLPVLPAVATEPAIASRAESSPSLPLLPFDDAIVGDAANFSESLSSPEEMIAESLHGPGLRNPSDRSSSIASYQMHYQGFAQLLGDPGLPEVGGVAGSIEHDSVRELNPSPGSFQQGRDLVHVGSDNMDGRVFLPQSVPDLQQLALFQKKCLEDNARQFVDFDHTVKAYQIQNSRLQQEKEQLQQEIQSLKSRLEQVAKSQVATWTGIMMDIQKKD